MMNAIPFIQGQKIFLRPLEEEDIRTSYQWSNDKSVRRYLNIGKIPLNFYHANEELRNVLKDKNTIVMAVILKENKKHIGNIAISHIDWINRNACIGVNIGDVNVWGKGIASEAFFFMLDYAFNELNLWRLHSHVHEDNVAALKFLDRLGCIREGRANQALLSEGKYRDYIYIAFLSPNFAKCRKKYIGKYYGHKKN